VHFSVSGEQDLVGDGGHVERFVPVQALPRLS
jgi:hypothetical protein